jgi:hypothetical protein
MTEGDYLKAIDLLWACERNIRFGDYDFAHINLLEALELLGEEVETEDLTKVRFDEGGLR